MKRRRNAAGADFLIIPRPMLGGHVLFSNEK